MIQAKVYNLSGQATKDVTLDASVFGVKIRPQVVQEAVKVQRANAREVLAHTKGRGEVRGGGKKPWKQKGTGRARHGSSRSPIWIGGGITFGPTKERNFSLKINKQVKKSALRMALSDKAANQHVYLLEDAVLKDNKTKQAQDLLRNLKLSGKVNPRVLVVLPHEKKDAVRAFKNINRVATLAVDSLNVVDIVGAQYMIMPEMCVEKILKLYGTK